jgi:hypothetical protein
MTRKEKQAQILALADAFDETIRDAFLEAIAKIKSDVVLTKIVAALEIGDVKGAMGFLSAASVTVAMGAFHNQLEAALVAGGILEQKNALAQRINFNFSVTNRPTAEFFNRHKAQWVSYMLDDQREMIAQVIRTNVAAGENPAVTARAIKQSIGLTPAQEKYIANANAQLKALDPAYFGRELRDARFDRTIRRAIKDQKALTTAQIEKITDAYRRRYIAKRATDIARTESITMLNAGGDQFWRQAVEQGTVKSAQLKRFWIPTADGKTRDAHRQIPKLNKDGVGLNEPFRSPLGLIMYAGDPAASAANRINCRCTNFTRIEV